MLSNEIKISQVMGYFAAGTTAKTTSIVDMDNCEGVIFVAMLGTVVEAGTVALKVQQDDANATTGMADLTGAVAEFTAGASDSGKMVAVDVYKPTKRYLQAVLTPAVQNSVICGVLAIQYGPRVKPTALTATLKALTKSISPSE